MGSYANGEAYAVTTRTAQKKKEQEDRESAEKERMCSASPHSVEGSSHQERESATLERSDHQESESTSTEESAISAICDQEYDDDKIEEDTRLENMDDELFEGGKEEETNKE